MGCANSRPAPKPPRQAPILASEPVQQVSNIKVKLVLLGDSGVGKSCLVQRYVRGAFDPSSKITVGAAFQSHSLRLPDGKTLKLEIWDTAGQERYASLAPLYYRGAAAAIIVYDVTSKTSFTKAKHWIQELHRNASDDLVVALVGNKTDLVEDRCITEEEGKALADSNGMIFVETSARTAANCGLVFEAIAKAVTGYVEPVGATKPSSNPKSASLPQSDKLPESQNPVSVFGKESGSSQGHTLPSENQENQDPKPDL